MTCNSVTIATLSSFDHYVSWSQKAQLQVRQLVSYFIIYTVQVHVRVISTNSRTVTKISIDVILKDDWLDAIRISIWYKLLLNSVSNIVFEAIDQQCFFHVRMILFLTEQLIVLHKAHWALFKSVLKIHACVFSFKRVITHMAKNSSIFSEHEDGTDAIFSIWHHQNESSLVNS